MRLNAEYAHPDSVETIVEGIENRATVAEVVYSPNLISQINQNVNKIGLILLGFSGILLLIAIALINNTIRLPFTQNDLLFEVCNWLEPREDLSKDHLYFQESCKAFMPVLLLSFNSGSFYAVRMEIPEFFEFTDILMFVKLFGLVALLGIIISGLSTLFAVRRYLRMDARKIY